MTTETQQAISRSNPTSSRQSGPAAPTDVLEARYDTPVGPLTVLFEPADGAAPSEPPTAVVLAAGFCGGQELADRLPGWDGSPQPGQDHPSYQPIDAAVQAYLGGDGTALDTVPVRQAGTDLRQRVWAGLRAIPAGQTRTYSELAQAAGKPRAVRAVGSACGVNLIAPFVPCHRALRRDGGLGGYYYGLEAKRWLLELEGAS